MRGSYMHLRSAERGDGPHSEGRVHAHAHLVESLVARAVLIDERLEVRRLGGRRGHLHETTALEEPGRSAQLAQQLGDRKSVESQPAPRKEPSAAPRARRVQRGALTDLSGWGSLARQNDFGHTSYGETRFCRLPQPRDKNMIDRLMKRQ